MPGFRSLDRSAALVQGMAARTGTDLATPQAAIRFRQMVLACTACQDRDGCARLQATNDRLDAAPDFCRNRAAMGG